MSKPSESWLGQYKNTLVPEMFVKVTHYIGETYEQKDAETTVSVPVKDYSNVSEVIDSEFEPSGKYATGEPNLWVLDGSHELVPDSESYENVGIVTEDINPVFAEITISFGKTITKTIPGITITWSTLENEYAEWYTVEAFNAGVSVAKSQNAAGGSVESFSEMELSNFDTLVIKVLEWCLPNRCVRIEKIEFGRKVTFDKQNLFSYTHESKRDPISGQLSKESIEFTVDNSDQKWNPVNPEGLYKYLYEQQNVKVKYGMDIDKRTEWINGGTYYLSGWDVSANSIQVSFEARDALTFLMDSTYTGRRYGTLYEMCYDALELLDVQGISFYISDDLKTYSTDITADNSTYKNSDILQLAANAAGMALYQTRDGEIRIERIPLYLADESNVEEIDITNNYGYPEITYAKALKNVSCTAGGETVFYPSSATGTGATQSVNNALINSSIVGASENALTAAYSLLANRRKVSLDYRASPHLDAFDVVKVFHQFGSATNVLITDVKYTFNGAFRGTMEGYAIANVRNVVITNKVLSAFKTLPYGTSFTLKAEITPRNSDSPSISWSASSDCVKLDVVINVNGQSECNVIWVKEGTATVTASVGAASDSQLIVCESSKLGDMPVGTELTIYDNGVATKVLVAKHDYESDLNGTGRTLIVYKDAIELAVWNSTGYCNYVNGELDNYLTKTVYNRFSDSLKGKIGTTVIPYTNVLSTVYAQLSNLSRSVFLLSAAEISPLANSYYSGNGGFLMEGSLLPIASSIQRGEYVSLFDAEIQLTRTPVYNVTGWSLSSSFNRKMVMYSCWMTERESSFLEVARADKDFKYGRPAFTVPSDIILKAGYVLD